MSDWRKLRRQVRRTLPRIISRYDDLTHLRQTFRAASLIEKVGRASKLAPGARSTGQRIVLFNTVRSYISIQLCVELLLALKMLAKGYEVRILIDDGILCHHDTLTRLDAHPFRSVSRVKRKLSLRALKQLPLLGERIVRYSELVSKAELSGIEQDLSSQSQLDIEPFVEASLVRFYLSAPDRELLEAEPDYTKARRMFELNTRISQAVAAKAIEQFDPSICVTSHGIYSTWGGFMRTMLDRGVRTICWGGNGYSSDKIDIALDDVAANKSDGGFYQVLVKRALDDQEFLRKVTTTINEMLTSRRSGTAVDIARLGVSGQSGTNPIIDRVAEARVSGKRVFALFPNVMWDNATTFKEWNRIFDSPVDWLIETIKFFQASDDKLLVVRAHPAEHLWMTVRKGVLDILERKLGKEVFEHQNILIINPQEPFSSYRLFEHLSGATVYNGTIGPELIHAGIPLILGAKAAYSDKGFTYDPTNKDDYFACYGKTDEIARIQNGHLDRAALFVYEYFHLHGVRVRFMNSQGVYEPCYEADPQLVWSDPGLEQLAASTTGERHFAQSMPEQLVRREENRS